MGLIISMINFAHAKWDAEDVLLKKSPKDQGWKQIEDRKATITQQFEKKS